MITDGEALFDSDTRLHSCKKADTLATARDMQRSVASGQPEDDVDEEPMASGSFSLLLSACKIPGSKYRF